MIYINELPDIVKQIDNPEEKDNEAGEDEDTEEASIIVFADDNSTTTSSEDVVKLQEKIEAEGKAVTEWFRRNEISCSAEKTKLLLSGTKAGRMNKIDALNISPSISLDGDIVRETASEKVLGVVVNNIITWNNHLNGDTENEGLIQGLSRRVGMLRKIRKFIPRKKFSQIVGGMFTSKLMYAMSLWGGLWDIPGTFDTGTRTSITKADMKRLQVLQNKAMRLETSLNYKTPTSELLNRTKKLSVHQLVAYTTAVQVYNIYRNQEPRYHYNRLFLSSQDITTRGSIVNRIDFSLSLCKSSFFHQGSRLWGSLPGHVRDARNIGTFKTLCKTWIVANIKIKP